MTSSSSSSSITVTTAVIDNITNLKIENATEGLPYTCFNYLANRVFPFTMWDERAAHALGVDYQGLQDKIKKGEVKHKIGGQIEMLEDGKYGEMWRDENPQALF